MVPPRRKRSEHSLDILGGKCSTTTPPFVIATEYRSAAFRGSLSHCTTSPIAGSHISLYIWCPRMHDSLRSSSIIFHVVANNNNLFPCLEIIGVFNFRTDARIRKFLDAKISYPKFFGPENFRIYGSKTRFSGELRDCDCSSSGVTIMACFMKAPIPSIRNGR